MAVSLATGGRLVLAQRALEIGRDVNIAAKVNASNAAATSKDAGGRGGKAKTELAAGRDKGKNF